ncbi:sugar ABC transporter substrate-binding protein [Nonomuraea gerenzanensis]|uniref:N-Acetyl-D-glucosamine ABC transport system, sugar-binding protein n=1 Tax=Nonomuraea gerenzanensis TaxID=93944 RepID=A0A1M4EBI7_9ACTN|nr:extracellular solute-binding protein [Nonomuraea gerenzanensis]UBU18286.1 extracellular solute-binding protein [Nonomuraea gerenzanensis]SBO96102.1 N-Acetyl-D-glucosamine ABC transport system, sugar-binding protein [Nonomuraea gerenzanensis]
MNRTSAKAAVIGAAVLTLAACASTPPQGGTTTAAETEGGAYTWWDPYPQHDAGSAWAKRVGACGQQAGVTIERTAYDTTALTNQALLAGQEGNAPDVILLDNPAVSTLADAGMLTAMSDFGLEVNRFDKNLIAAGELNGKTYGIPIGANTLALYYNKKILDDAGVDPATIKDWASLNAALKKVKAAGKKPITFAAIGTEEGSFQFLPWFWGAGAQLTQLDSPQAVEALQLWSSWLKDGLAPNSVISNSQNTTWEEFLTGEFAFAENGTWQINSAAEAGFPTGIVQIPGKDGGTAATPTGGEFITVPVQKDTKRYDVTKKILECMTTPEGLVETGTTFAYYIPSTADGQQAILAEEPGLKPWVAAVQSAKGRTSDNLGTKYPKISEALWTGVQKALSGAASPADALKDAQAQAQQATGD